MGAAGYTGFSIFERLSKCLKTGSHRLSRGQAGAWNLRVWAAFILICLFHHLKIENKTKEN
jgi:hypothetical protein